MPRRRLATFELSGEVVRLRAHRSSDGPAAYALLAGQDEILRWLVWDGPNSPEELSEHYQRWCLEGDGGPDLRLAIEDRASGALAGSLSLRFEGHAGQGDLGYWIGRQFQGQGFGQEALALAAHAAFRHLGAHALYAWVFVGNQASRRILERTGFTLARTVPGRVLKRRERVDEWHFVLLASEWRRLRADFRPQHESVAWLEEDASDPLEDPPRPFPSG
jgi:RimJ/RimL family protein N-acetyltransferase